MQRLGTSVARLRPFLMEKYQTQRVSRRPATAADNLAVPFPIAPAIRNSDNGRSVCVCSLFTWYSVTLFCLPCHIGNSHGYWMCRLLDRVSTNPTIAARLPHVDCKRSIPRDCSPRHSPEIAPYSKRSLYQGPTDLP